MKKNMHAITTNHLTNDELASIYDYMKGNIDQKQLEKEMHRARTNTYYYIGRAVHYWLNKGIIRFNPIHSQEDLGGSDLEGGKEDV